MKTGALSHAVGDIAQCGAVAVAGLLTHPLITHVLTIYVDFRLHGSLGYTAHLLTYQDVKKRIV